VIYREKPARRRTVKWLEKDCALCGEATYIDRGEEEYMCPKCGWRFKILVARPGAVLVDTEGGYELWDGIDGDTLEVERSVAFTS
jgi:hypothetical protein